MLAIGCLVAWQCRQDRSVGEIIHNRLMLGRSIALEPQQIIATLRQDQRCGVVLAMQGVGGDELAGEIEAGE